MGRPRRIWNTPAVLARLGKESDEVIAKDLSLSVHTIRAERVRKGIHMVKPSAPVHDYDVLLGIIPDAQLARLRGVTRQAITSRRQNLGIAACEDASVSALLLLEVRDRATENTTDVSIPTDLYERICDHLSR